jgi:hypothetical protein
VTISKEQPFDLLLHTRSPITHFLRFFFSSFSTCFLILSAQA